MAASAISRNYRNKSFDHVFGVCSIAIVTPFGIDGSLNVVGLQEVVEHVVDGADCPDSGCIIVCGSTGEQHSMTVQEKNEVYRSSVMFVGGKMPVVAGVAAVTTADAVELAIGAVDAGCDGLMLGLPPYLNLQDDEINGFVEAVVKNISVSDVNNEGGIVPRIPILFYNNVGRNGYGPSVETISKWHRQGWIGGVKVVGTPGKSLEATGEEVSTASPGIRTYTGSDVMYMKLKQEDEPSPIYGVTSILGNLYPKEVFDMVHGINHQDRSSEVYQAAVKAYKKMSEVADSCLVGVSLPVGIKVAMNELGVSAGVCRPPLGVISDESTHKIKTALQRYQQKK